MPKPAVPSETGCPRAGMEPVTPKHSTGLWAEFPEALGSAVLLPCLETWKSHSFHKAPGDTSLWLGHCTGSHHLRTHFWALKQVTPEPY